MGGLREIGLDTSVGPPAGQLVGKLGRKAAADEVAMPAGPLRKVFGGLPVTGDQLLACQCHPVLRLGGECLAHHVLVDLLPSEFGDDPIRTVTPLCPGTDQALGEAAIRLPALDDQPIEHWLDLVGSKTPIGQLASKLPAAVLTAGEQADGTLLAVEQAALLLLHG